MKREVNFSLEKPTKNTFKFLEDTTSAHAVGAIYVQKHVFDGIPPKTIKVTIEWE